MRGPSPAAAGGKASPRWDSRRRGELAGSQGFFVRSRRLHDGGAVVQFPADRKAQSVWLGQGNPDVHLIHCDSGGEGAVKGNQTVLKAKLTLAKKEKKPK